MSASGYGQNRGNRYVKGAKGRWVLADPDGPRWETRSSAQSWIAQRERVRCLYDVCGLTE